MELRNDPSTAIYEIRTCNLKVGIAYVDAYLSILKSTWADLRADGHGKLVGCWSTDFGALSRVVQIIRYDDVAHWHRSQAALDRDPRWIRDYVKRSGELIASDETKLVSTVMPLVPPLDGGHVFELRTYLTLPGRTDEWLELFLDIYPARHAFLPTIVIWRTIAGRVNEVVHICMFRDLNDRAERRTRFEADAECREFILKSNPLVAHAESIVLTPVSFSPLK